VFPGDTPDTLAERLLVEEHRLYPRAIRRVIEGRVSIDNGELRITDGDQPDVAQLTPTSTH
jgi:phosphoribosylglycinamide formyltransferase-1